MNPRVSRSSALASKATGFPIAKIAARLAVGYALEEIPNDITRRTPASFEPTIDYAVVKIPRFAFEKFPVAEGGLTTQMKSVGEAMAIGRTFKQAFMKAMRSRELDAVAEPPDDTERAARRGSSCPSHDRYELLFEALRRGVGVEELQRAHGDPPLVPAPVRGARRGGARAARARSPTRRTSASPTSRPASTRERAASRRACGPSSSRSTPARPSSRPRRPTSTPPTSAAASATARAEVRRGSRPSVVILGSGPNRIGQGIEFDYCCVHAAMTVRELGRDAVMINCNPETVSTDYDTSDRLYFEPLTVEDVLEVVEVEQPEGVIVQFGGQTPLRIAAQPGAGRACRCSARRSTSIDLAEDRGRFGAVLAELGIRHPPYGVAHSPDGGVERGARGRLPAARAAVLRARRPRDGDLLLARPTSRAYLERARGRRRERRASRCTRCCSTASSRTRSRSTSTRSPTARTPTSRASCSTSRRRASTPATRPACCRRSASASEMLEEIRRQTTRARAAARRRRAAERAVRARRQRPPLRDRGQPARLAHGAVRLEGDRRAAREGRLPPDPGRAAARPGAAAPSASRRPRQRQGGGAAVPALPRLRRAARARR